MRAHNHNDQAGSSSRGKWVLIGFLSVAAYFLWTEHRAHLMGALPYLLLLACPLMHLFHHHGHGGHQRGHQLSNDREQKQSQNCDGDAS